MPQGLLVFSTSQKKAARESSLQTMLTFPGGEDQKGLGRAPGGFLRTGRMGKLGELEGKKNQNFAS